MTLRYVLTTAAESDLREVLRYTRRQWGAAQARRYVGQLQRCVEILATGDGGHRDLEDLHPGLRVVRCEHHDIFCLPRIGAPALIIAILRERMDLMARIAGRLGWAGCERRIIGSKPGDLASMPFRAIQHQ